MAKGIWHRGLMAAACVVGLTCCRSAQAQQDGLVFDPARGVYTIEYVDDSGMNQIMDIVPPNRVAPSVEATAITATGNVLQYRYTISNTTGQLVDQDIGTVELGCAAGIQTESLVKPPAWNTSAGMSAQTERPVCEYALRLVADGIPPGTSKSGFGVDTRFLPSVVPVAVWGVRGDIEYYPGIDDVRPELGDLVSTVNGMDGGWFETQAVGPAIAPENLADPAVGIAYLLSSLGEACDLGWVDDTTGVCHSLEVKLEQAQASIQADRPSARNQIQAFLNELEAQRGQHVNENAYWLLTVNAQHVLTTV
ncbi:MAG: hypothetical protein WBO43_13175 [Gemmatimonadota bacterium]